jgi:hypothetical protein
MRAGSDSKGIIKLAVVFEDRGKELFKIDQSLPLAPQIQDVCALWNISAEQAVDYALQFDEEKSPEINDRYITENNRAHIKTGE